MSSSPVNITASVVLYRTPPEQLELLLESLAQSSLRPRLYVVDNSPTPTTIPAKYAPWITYIASPQNRGYGASHNTALRQLLDVAEFHFVLNPDIYFGRDELKKMIDFMLQHPTVGQVMPKVVYPEGDLQYLCKLIPTPADLLARRFLPGPLKLLAKRQMERYELRFTGYKSEMDVPVLSGCFMLFRTSVLRETGLFDERFFMYAEDTDLGRRVHARSRTVFYPDATVVHAHTRESYKNKRALWMHIKSLIKYFNKWGWLRDEERSRTNRETLQHLSRQA